MSKREKKHFGILLLATAGLIIAVEIILERYLCIEAGDSSRYSLAFVARAVDGLPDGAFERFQHHGTCS